MHEESKPDEVFFSLRRSFFRESSPQRSRPPFWIRQSTSHMITDFAASLFICIGTASSSTSSQPPPRTPRPVPRSSAPSESRAADIWRGAAGMRAGCGRRAGRTVGPARQDNSSVSGDRPSVAPWPGNGPRGNEIRHPACHLRAEMSRGSRDRSVPPHVPAGPVGSRVRWDMWVRWAWWVRRAWRL